MKENESGRLKKSANLTAAVGSLPVAYILELHRMIELAAYYRAEQDGFRLSPLDYWLAAEHETQMLS